MKMKFRGLAFTAMLLSGTSMAIADQGAAGDLPGYGEEAYFHEEAAYGQEVQPVAHAENAQYYAPTQSTNYAPVGASELQQTSFRQRVGSRLHGGGCGCEDSSCDGGCNMGGCDSGCGVSGCDGGCDSGCGSKRGKICNIFNHCDSDTWASAEFLMWFAQDRDMPSLVGTSAPGTLPTTEEETFNSVFGDDIEGELSGGVRTDYGKWLTDNVGIGGRFWILAENQDSVFLQGDGSDQSIGRPFFNTDTDTEDALLIALDGVFTGSVAAESSLDVMAAEAYGRFRFTCNNSCRLDFIGGYTHFNIDDVLRISSTTETDATARVRTYGDIFDVENRFNGGQLGFESTITRGCWQARSLTKVHLGNMNQTVTIAGQASDQTPPAGATITSGGFLTQGNQGVFTRDTFAFAPEANFKLAYKFRPNVSLSVGYSFIYWDNVALAGDMVDRAIDGTQLNTGVFASRPAFDFNDSSLWVQGIDLGFGINY